MVLLGSERIRVFLFVYSSTVVACVSSATESWTSDGLSFAASTSGDGCKTEKVTYPNGVLASAVRFTAERRPNGIWTHRYPSGKVRSIIEYESGIRNGPFVHLDANGSVLSGGRFESGDKAGLWIEAAEGSCDAVLGANVGPLKELMKHYGGYLPLPTVCEEAPTRAGVLLGEYDDGQRDGLWRQYVDGEITCLGRFEQGRAHGDWMLFAGAESAPIGRATYKHGAQVSCTMNLGESPSDRCDFLPMGFSRRCHAD